MSIADELYVVWNVTLGIIVIIITLIIIAKININTIITIMIIIYILILVLNSTRIQRKAYGVLRNVTESYRALRSSREFAYTQCELYSVVAIINNHHHHYHHFNHH